MMISCVVACRNNSDYSLLVPIHCHVTTEEYKECEHVKLIESAMYEIGYKGPMVVIDQRDTQVCQSSVQAALKGLDWASALNLQVKSRLLPEPPKPQDTPRPLHTAYLIVICHPVTNVVLGAEIWSKPEWEQGRCLPERTYVAWKCVDESYSKAKDNLTKQLEDSSCRYAWLRSWLDVQWRAESDRHLQVLNELEKGG